MDMEPIVVKAILQRAVSFGMIAAGVSIIIDTTAWLIHESKSK